MELFRCPVCGQALHFGEREAVCPANHRYDRARQGHINLLMSQAAADRRHGDDRPMVEARRRFLAEGHYAPLMECIARMAAAFAPDAPTLLDAGCGEGYYTEAVAAALAAAGKTPRVAAIDISKDSAKAIARRPFPKEVAVASAFALPIPDASCDIILDIFAPCAEKEFLRVLKPGGVLLRAVPLPRHLMGLKSAIYDTPYLNNEVVQALPGFEDAGREDLCWMLHLDSREKIHDLFLMTPYYYKTSAADQAKVAALDALDTELAFAVLANRKTF